MQVSALNCPTCGAPVPQTLAPQQQFACTACGSILVLTDISPSDHVLCPQCKTLNRDDQEFCSQCGADLKLECPYCYVSNPVGTAHCRGCGVNLQRAWQRRKDWLAEKRKYDEERLADWRQTEADSRKNQIARLLDDLDEPENHAMAIYCLNQLGSEAVEPLIDLLRTDDDPDARFGAAHALGSLADPRAIPALVGALSDSEPAVRYWAVDALAKLRAAEAVEPIGDLLRDPHKGVREHAAQALAQIGGPRAADLLKKKSRWWRFG